MVSGLEFQESYKHYNSDALKMLYDSDDMAQFAADKNRTAEPGEVWNYSSGTTNILSKCLRNEFGNDSLYWNFPYDELFDKIGMNSAIFEVDASGTFIGSTSVYVTARDWAKFGLLYAQKGVWNGENIFDEDWLFYSATPTMNSRQRKFGAHLWIKPLDPKVDQKIIINKLPDDYCYASGHYGQYLSVIPSEELVVVRLGFTKNSHDWNQEKFVADILSTINKN